MSKFNIQVPEKLEWDVLGRDNYLSALCRSSTEYFDNHQKFEWNVFLIDWSWWTGKSWVVHHYINCIEESEASDISVHEFSAWQYMDENMLFIDFWNSIELQDDEHTSGAQKDDKKIYEMKNRLKKLGWLMRVLPDMIFASTKSWIQLEPIIEWIKNIDVSAVENLAITLWPPVAHVLIVVLERYIKNKLKDDENKKLQEILNKLKKYSEYDKIYDSFMSNSDRFDIEIKPTVIVIEDLDRVQYEKLWRIFSILSVFNKKANLLFVLVWSSHYLESIIEQKYNVKWEGENFLAKFISLRLPLPPFTKNNAIEWLFNVIDKNCGLELEENMRENVRSFLNGYFLPDNISYRTYKLDIEEMIVRHSVSLSNFFEWRKSRLSYWIPLIVYLSLNKKGYVFRGLCHIYEQYRVDGHVSDSLRVLWGASVTKLESYDDVDSWLSFEGEGSHVDAILYILWVNKKNISNTNQSLYGEMQPYFGSKVSSRYESFNKVLKKRIERLKHDYTLWYKPADRDSAMKEIMELLKFFYFDEMIPYGDIE